MKIDKFIKLSVVILALSLTSCSTSHQFKSLTGGYSSTQLSNNTFQVRFQGNGYTSQDKTSQYILRRCAEITLEEGKRYFSMMDNQNMSSNPGNISFPSGQATFKLLDAATDNSLDAVFVIRNTNAVAKNKISSKASEKLAQFEQ